MIQDMKNYSVVADYRICKSILWWQFKGKKRVFCGGWLQAKKVFCGGKLHLKRVLCGGRLQIKRVFCGGMIQDMRK